MREDWSLRPAETLLCQDIKRGIVALEHDVGHAGAPRLVFVSPVDCARQVSETVSSLYFGYAARDS